MGSTLEIVFRLLGLFYVASGVLVVRALAVGVTADAIHAALMGGAPHPAERIREIWLAAGSVVIAAGGLSLMLVLDAAAVLFALGTLQQLVYLFVVAPRFLDPYDAPDPAGRTQTRNAALIHLAVTVAVVAAAATGSLRPWHAEPGWLLAAAIAAVVAGAVWTARVMRRPAAFGEAD